jgi:broad specificity phosphatase PhoE
MGQYYFVRHGESEANRDGWLAGHRDSPLTQRGVDQAHGMRPRIAALDVHVVLVSDSSRAQDTARIMLGKRTLPQLTTPLLRERGGGEWEGRPVEELRAGGHLVRVRRWYERPPGGESLSDVVLRALEALCVYDQGQNVLVVTHGALIRGLLCAVDAGPGGELSSRGPDNLEVHVRSQPPGGWTALRARCLEHARIHRDAAPA